VHVIARCEVGDLDRAAVRVGEHGVQHGGVVEIGLLRRREPAQLDRKRAIGGRGAGGLAAAQKRTEDRIGIEARQAGENDAGLGVNQCRDTAVADDGEIQAAHRRWVPSY
jgi:hypothetical protein